MRDLTLGLGTLVVILYLTISGILAAASPERRPTAAPQSFVTGHYFPPQP